MIFDRVGARNSRREIKGSSVTAAAAVAENQSPEALNVERISRWILKRSQLAAGCRIKRIDFTIAKIPNQQSAAECAEVGRSEEHTSELQSHSFISYAVFCLK